MDDIRKQCFLSGMNPFLQDAVVEFKRMENIDIFNAAWAFVVMPDLWGRMRLKNGQLPPIINEQYAESPWITTLQKHR